jgi:hypothetical protein
MVFDEPAGTEQKYKISDILRDIAADRSRDRIFVRDLVDVMPDRAMATLLFVFALPNVLPAPPGTSSVLGTPLVLLSAQLMLGVPPWLPDIIGARSIGRRNFASIVTRAMPWLARAEGLLQPRLEYFVLPSVQRVIGALCLVLALILILPIPLGNSLPALAICVFALGMIAHDGVWIIAGVATTIGAVALAVGVVYALAETAYLVLDRIFF